MSGKFFQQLATATATASTAQGLLQTGVLGGGLVGMALSRLQFGGTQPTVQQETIARAGQGRVPMEEIKQAQLSHELPTLPVRPMAFGEAPRQTIPRGMTTSFRLQAIALVQREIGVLGSGQTQGTLFRQLLSKFRQMEMKPTGDAKKRQSDFKFENPETWPAPFVSIVDELLALMFKGQHMIRLSEDEVRFVRAIFGAFLYSNNSQLQPIDVFSATIGAIRSSFLEKMKEIKGDDSKMATELILKLQKLPAVDPQLTAYLGGELAYDDASYEDIRTVKRFKPAKKEDKKTTAEKTSSVEDKEDGKSYANQTPETQRLVRRWHSLLLGRYITLQCVHNAGEIQRLIDELSQIYPTLSEIGAMAVRLGLVLLASGGNVLPSGVRSQTAQDIGFVMVNVGELSDEQILAYLKDVFLTFGFGTLEEHTNETRFISALHDEYAVQNAIGFARDTGDSLRAEDFIVHGSAQAVADLGRTELVKQQRQGGPRRKENQTINSEAVALLQASNDEYYATNTSGSESEEEKAYEINLFGASFARPRRTTLSPDVLGISPGPSPPAIRQSTQSFNEQLESYEDITLDQPKQPVQSERVLTNQQPRPSPLIEEEEKVPSPPKKNRTYANNSRAMNKVDAVVRVSKQMSQLLAESEHLRTDPVKKRRAVAMDARQTITRAFEDLEVSEEFTQAGRQIGGVVQVLLSNAFDNINEIEGRVSELVRSRFQSFARRIIKPDQQQLMLEILTRIFEMYDLIQFFKTLKVADVIRMVTTAVEKLFKEQTASRGNVPPRRQETELLPDGGAMDVLEIEMEELIPSSVSVNISTYPLYKELRGSQSEIEFENVDLENQIETAIERADPSVQSRPNLLGRIMAMLAPSREEVDIEDPLLPEKAPRRRSARQRANDVMRAMVGVARRTSNFVPERMRPSGERVRAFNRRVKNNAGKIGAGIGGGGILWTALSYLLEEGDVTPPTGPVVVSGPSDTEPKIEIVHTEKKRFTPAEFMIESELDVRQRDIEDKSTPDVVIEKKREALPKKRGRPRKPFFKAEEIVRQENDAPVQTNP